MKNRFIVLLFLLGFFSLTAQVENIPVNNPVYGFLKQMQVKGVISGYDESSLPIARSKVIHLLNQIEKNNSWLSSIEKELLIDYQNKIDLKKKRSYLFDNLIPQNQSYLYHYSDSSLNFFFNPIVDVNFYHSVKAKENSALVNVGGKAFGSYDGWLGFYLQGSNGVVWGDRETAKLDQRVAQNYTFNNTGINFFDGTAGYLKLEKGPFSFQFGRERVLWGNGYNERLILSSNPPIFDFAKFEFEYKSLSYKFLHGWIVQTPSIIFVDSLIREIKIKPSKYFAVSRLGINPTEKIKLGVSQIVIYGNRPFEAAYLNPFLFWESAQRSMQDLDNSFLYFDGRFLLFNGAEIEASVLLDDIKYENWFNGNWNSIENRLLWGTGIYLANPILPQNSFLKLNYTQIRPYTFSHVGIGEQLTYTSNDYLLGISVPPNSTVLTASADYNFSSSFGASIRFRRILHGENIYDSNGKLLVNHGGSVKNHPSLFDNQKAKLLAGSLQKNNIASLTLSYEWFYNSFINLTVNHNFNLEEDRYFNLTFLYNYY